MRRWCKDHQQDVSLSTNDLSKWILICLIHHMSSCITCSTFYNYYFINISIKNVCVHIIHLCPKPKSHPPHNVMYSRVPRHQDFLLFSKSTDQWFWALSQLCTAFTHDLCTHSHLKTAGALWGNTKPGRVNNTEKYI